MSYGAVIAVPPFYREELKQRGEDEGFRYLERIIVSLRRAGIRDLVLLGRKEGEAFPDRFKFRGLVLLPGTGEGLLEDVREGLCYLRERCAGVFFCPLTVPFFKTETLERMMEGKGSLILPSFRGRTGHPILFSSEAMKEIFSYHGGGGLRDACGALPDSLIERIAVEDEGILVHVSHGGDFEELERKSEARLIRPELRLRISREKPIFGPGMVTLLRQIEALGSVREACERTGISYSKAWTMIHNCERELPFLVVERHPGGKYGGAASLSKRGKDFLLRYEAFSREMDRISEEKFQEFFGDFFPA